MAGADVAVPLHASSALPDCVVRADAFDRGMQRAWRAGERFRMFFAGKGHWRAGTLSVVVRKFSLPCSPLGSVGAGCACTCALVQAQPALLASA